MSALLYREARFDRAKIDKSKRSAEVSFSSEEPVARFGENEILGHNEGEFDFTRLNDGGALLLGHDDSRQIGVVERAWVASDGQRRVGRALVRFSNSPLGQEIFQDVQDRIRQKMSVGYERTKILSRSKQEGVLDAVRYAWRAFELSLVAVPADLTVGVGRGHEHARRKMNDPMKTELDPVSEIRERTKYLARHSQHVAGQLDNLRDRALAEGWPLETWSAAAMNLLDRNPAPKILVPVFGHDAGMNRSEVGQFSLVRALRSATENSGVPKNCFEADVCEQAARNSSHRGQGFLIPTDIVLGANRQDYGQQQRDMQVGVFGQGGATVATQIPTPIIELLRNRMVVLRLGARVLAGLEGHVALPRQTAAGTAQSLGEIAALTDSNQTIDQIPVSPHRVGATTTYSKQLLIQSSLDIENFIRDDLTKIVAISHDRFSLNGSGAGSEPLGVMNTPGIGSVLFGGAATWAKVVSFETTLASLNADQGRMAFVVAPNVKGSWKGTAVALTGAATVSARPLWEPGNFPDEPSDGLVNGYRSAATNQLSAGQVLFGNFLDLTVALFGGLDIVVDPFTLAKNAEVVITVNSWLDVAVLHAASFAISADSGAQ